jgi:hypothetical protein
LSSLTKILIVLQLVFALVCSVLLVLMVSKQENYKTTADGMNTRVVGLAAQLVAKQTELTASDAAKANALKQASDATSRADQAETELTTLQKKLDATSLELKGQIANLEAKNTELTAASAAALESLKAKDAELDKLRPQIAELAKKYGESNQALSEANNQLRAATNAIRQLQEQLTTAGGAGAGAVAPLNSENQITTYAAVTGSTTPVNGKITAVENTAGRTLVELPLGTRDGLHKGSKLYVYRSTGYVGELEVETITPDQSIASVSGVKPGETVQKGDLVATVAR